MIGLSLTELALVGGFCALLLAGVIVALLVMRSVIARMEDATGNYEILREHPHLLEAVPWGVWTDSVNLTAPRPVRPEFRAGPF